MLTHEDQKQRAGRAKKTREESRRAPSGGRDVNICFKSDAKEKEEPPTTYFRHRVHVLCMRGDSPQGLGRRARRRVALLHQVGQIDVTCKAIAGCVARTLFFTRGLQRHKA